MNCSKPLGLNSVQDDILRIVCSPIEESLGENDQTHQSNSLTSPVDVVQAADPALIQTFSGGSVSFIFERCSAANEVDIN